MAVKNSELRSFAQGAQAGGGFSLLWLIAPLLILVPVGAYYVWSTQPDLVAQYSAMFSKSTSATATRSVAAGAVAGVAQAKPGVVSPVAAPAPKVDMQAANAALARGLNLATKDQSLTFMLSASDYSDSISGASDARGKPKKVISPNDVFGYCVQQVEGLVRSRVPAGKKFDAGAGMIMTSEILLCGLKRGGDKLCAKDQKVNLARQITFYLDLREGALAALSSDKPAQMLARAALESGTHQDIRTELRKLASRGVITPGDFGLFTPSYIGETIGDFKSVASVCKG